MDRLVEHLFVFEGNGSIKDFQGNYTDYRDYLDDNKTETLPEPKKEVKSQPEAAVAQPTKKKVSFQEKQEYEKLEKELAKLEEEKKVLDDLINKGSTNHKELSEWSNKIGLLEKEIESKSDRWHVLSELIG
jgi:ATP-binding cassette subfamily F protein uup